MFLKPLFECHFFWPVATSSSNLLPPLPVLFHCSQFVVFFSNWLKAHPACQLHLILQFAATASGLLSPPQSCHPLLKPVASFSILLMPPLLACHLLPKPGTSSSSELPPLLACCLLLQPINISYSSIQLPAGLEEEKAVGWRRRQQDGGEVNWPETVVWNWRRQRRAGGGGVLH